MKTILTTITCIAVGILLLSTAAQANELHDAAGKGDKGKVEKLLSKGANVNAKDIDGNTPLHLAALKGEKEVAELLIAKGADVNAKDIDGRTPLHMAVFMGNKEVAELLIAKGADVNAKDNGGNTPLDIAKTEDIRKILLAHGVKPGR